MKMKLALLLAALAVAFPAAAQHKAHAHGKASLNVAIEGSRLTLEFESPLEDLVGFERAPANDKERAAIDALTAYFKSGQAFAPNAEAGCKLAGSDVQPTAPQKGHAELHARLRYDCADARALTQLEAAVMKQYPRLKRIDVQVAGAKRQSASRLTPASRVLKL